jgi:hypothetical protein
MSESTEGSGVPMAGAEVGPVFEDGGSGISCFGDESSIARRFAVQCGGQVRSHFGLQ